jgi:diaminopropionate ammonia-lyase
MLKTGDYILNAQSDREAIYDERCRNVLTLEGAALARSTISGWPGYAPTPLLDLPDVAREVGVSSVHYKDESARFGLMSFKALGGAYAVVRHLLLVIQREVGETATVDDILAGRYADIVERQTVCCATDGNHGRSVAWGARTFGCRAVIFIHATVSEGRRAAIEAFGAEVRRTAGNYDASVAEADATASREGWTVVSDTSYPGYRTIPCDVMHGYTLMAQEAYDQLPGDLPATHQFVQTGVGGMAAAVCAQGWQLYGSSRPRTILADPTRAACWFASIRAGKPVAVTGDIDTLMAGLACGEVSELAWEILDRGADAVVAVEDKDAEDGMRRLAGGGPNTPPIVAGESAVAGLAALLAVAKKPSARDQLALTADSRVLLFGTEGATDPAVYARIVGRSADSVLRQAAD